MNSSELPHNAAAGSPAPHPQPHAMPHSAQASMSSSYPHAQVPPPQGTQPPHFATQGAHSAYAPLYPAQYHHHGSYLDSFARPRWWSWSHSFAPPPVNPPPPPAVPSGVAYAAGGHLPPPPHEYHMYRAYNRYYHRRRGPRVLPFLAVGAVVFFTARHFAHRDREQERERFMARFEGGGVEPSSSTLASAWSERSERRCGPWNRHDHHHHHPRRPATETEQIQSEEKQQTHEEMWAEQWAKAMGRVSPAAESSSSSSRRNGSE
ncbi:hypothetical protein JCM10908_004742 [Rhodotorula pacifica]|uniref:uncharacterized protein n=1 Tax=Rhodotorula pacifica TaxID=1495444 RepID=UPI00317DABF4